METDLKNTALIIYTKLEKNLENVKAFLNELGYNAISKSYKKFTTTDMTDAELAVIITSDAFKIEVDSFLEKVVSQIMDYGMPLLVLGDINSIIVNDLLGYKVALVENHILREDEVHNIVNAEDDEYYIPSRHLTTIEVPELVFLDTSIKGTYRNTAILEVACLSPNRENKVPEIEIFLIRNFNYLGIFGAPEILCVGEGGGSCKISRDLFKYISNLLLEIL